MDDDEISMETQELDMEVSFEKRFGWYVVLNRVSENRITAHDEITKKGIIEVMNQLVYLIEYSKEEQRLMKKAMSSN